MATICAAVPLPSVCTELGGSGVRRDTQCRRDEPRLRKELGGCFEHQVGCLQLGDHFRREYGLLVGRCAVVVTRVWGWLRRILKQVRPGMLEQLGQHPQVEPLWV